jgi:xanthine dehydrogenase YagS FAD-binding subunit
VLAGGPATAEWFGRAADAELAAAAPLPDNAFKVTLARNVIVRMLCELAGTARAGAGS